MATLRARFGVRFPAADWPATIAEAIDATVGRRTRLACGGSGPARPRPARRAAVSEVLGDGQHVTLTADLGPRERYRRWLAIRRGQVRVVLGTRAAAFAPVDDLGLVALWDDGDDLHAEPRAPYPHVREVLALRSHQCDSGSAGGRLRANCRGGLPDRLWLRAVVGRAARDSCARTRPEFGRPTTRP